MTIDTTSLLAISSEMFGKYDIITLPESANYEGQDTLNVLSTFLLILKRIIPSGADNSAHQL